MFVIEVIPLQRGVQIGTLSYFSSEDYPLGTLLSIPVRNRDIRGIVTSSQPVGATRTALRAATFSLKRLPAQKDTKKLSPAFIETARILSDYYASEAGSVLFALLPPEVRDGKIPLPHTHHVERHEHVAPELLQGTYNDRYLAYRSLIRETFVHGSSVILVVPSSGEAESAYTQLAGGIEDRVVVVTSTMGIKMLRASYEMLGDFSKPKLIIATPAHALLERHDVSVVIIENSRSNLYRERTRPYLDTREVLKVHSRQSGRRLIFGDLLPRTEEETLRRDEIYSSIGDIPKRIAFPGTVSILEMAPKADTETPFTLFSPKVVEALLQTRKEKGRSFLFSARRGLASLVVCIDCGHIFRSPESGAPYSLVRTMKSGIEERWFVCAVSGHRERAADTCPNCTSWRLKERGIGIQHAHDELSKLLPNVPLMIFDHITASTHKKATFLQNTFYKTKGTIMLGTQMAIPYLTRPIETSVVINMDALHATPTWRQQEETLSLLLSLRERTTGTVHIQTRTPPDELLEYARSGALERFYDEEIELRKAFQYPPFSHFVHLTWQGDKTMTQKIGTVVRETLKDYPVTYYSAPPAREGTSIEYGLLRFPRKEWPNPQVVTLLRTLPPSVRVVMNPERIV